MIVPMQKKCVAFESTNCIKHKQTRNKHRSGPVVRYLNLSYVISYLWQGIQDVGIRSASSWQGLWNRGWLPHEFLLTLSRGPTGLYIYLGERDNYPEMQAFLLCHGACQSHWLFGEHIDGVHAFHWQPSISGRRGHSESDSSFCWESKQTKQEKACRSRCTITTFSKCSKATLW